MEKILVVDDLEDVRRLVSATLVRAKCQILTAGNSVVAIEMARDQRPDLIIMDLTMPGSIDGFEAIRILKNDPETRDSAIIILTGSGLEKTSRNFSDAGVDAYFAKPFSPLKLIQKVEEILARRRAQLA
jgi:CheY-like chemotaxis protein